MIFAKNMAGISAPFWYRKVVRGSWTSRQGVIKMITRGWTSSSFVTKTTIRGQTYNSIITMSIEFMGQCIGHWVKGGQEWMERCVSKAGPDPPTLAFIWDWPLENINYYPSRAHWGLANLAVVPKICPSVKGANKIWLLTHGFWSGFMEPLLQHGWTSPLLTKPSISSLIPPTPCISSFNQLN